MNLLVTNTRNAQAYAIIRALRPHSRKIVATMEGDKRLAARLSHAANSRLLDKRYYTPSPAEDWRAGRIQRENTVSEENYVRAVERICEKEKIDTIFPSFDPHVYVFSKNKARFGKVGILIPVPDFDTAIIPLDKYRTILAAREVGFPCPLTYLPESENDLESIVLKAGFPLVIKPRFTSAGRGMAVARNFCELSEKISVVKKTYGMPLVQEYIPGGHRNNFHFVINGRGELRSVFSGKISRSFRISGGFGTGQESTVPHPYIKEATRLVHRLGWWGGTLVETLVDPRDGLPKLMEINPRFGNRLWVRTVLGINEPLMCLKIARGEDVGAEQEYPAGIVMLDPMEDLLLLGYHLLDLTVYRFRIGVLRKKPVDLLTPPMDFRQLVKSYSQTYFNDKKKFFNPYFKNFFHDPLVSMLWWFQYFLLILRATRRVGT
jgi:biotin carboxylase